jgi:hypothetical protein
MFFQPWLLDSGASRYMTSSYENFLNHVPRPKEQTVKLADGWSQAITGSGTVKCSSNMTIPCVLHVPSFPLNLLSISCLPNYFYCVIVFFTSWCYFQELGNGKRLGTGIKALRSETQVKGLHAAAYSLAKVKDKKAAKRSSTRTLQDSLDSPSPPPRSLLGITCQHLRVCTP